MSTRPYREIRDAARAQWSDDARAVGDAAGAYFRTIAEKQVELGRELAAMRTRRSMTQKQLEEISGVNQAEISRIETGRANPTEETLIRLATALDVKLVLEPS